MQTLRSLSKDGLNLEACARLAVKWPEIVGENFAKHLRPVNVLKGVVTMEGSSAAWTQEARFLETVLLEKIRKAVPGAIVDELRFRTARTWSRRGTWAPATQAEAGPRLNLEAVPADRERTIDGIVASLDDDELRERLRKIFRLATVAEIERTSRDKKR